MNYLISAPRRLCTNAWWPRTKKNRNEEKLETHHSQKEQHPLDVSLAKSELPEVGRVVEGERKRDGVMGEGSAGACAACGS